jgi:hypothetical protein
VVAALLGGVAIDLHRGFVTVNCLESGQWNRQRLEPEGPSHTSFLFPLSRVQRLGLFQQLPGFLRCTRLDLKVANLQAQLAAGASLQPGDRPPAWDRSPARVG